MNVQGSWVHASKKQREKLLELIRRLAEDDKEGVMAHKVLVLLWNLAQSEDVTTDIMDQALAAHIKILDYSCSQVCSQVCWVSLARMDENTKASQAIFEPPPENWRRPPGQLCTTWMKNIHDDLSSLDLWIYEATHTHTFNSSFSGTTQVSRYQKGKNQSGFY